VATGRQPVAGGVLLETPLWAVTHTFGPLALGTLIVAPKRHVLHVADLTDVEALELGPLLRRAAAASTELIHPDQVYIELWSHAGGTPGHIHFVVMPVTRELMDELGVHGPGVAVRLFERGESIDPAAVDAIAPDIRALLTR
jgi:diadenosine tetraphosphate (Ap4A) HIT family hydrolase